MESRRIALPAVLALALLFFAAGALGGYLVGARRAAPLPPPPAPEARLVPVEPEIPEAPQPPKRTPAPKEPERERSSAGRAAPQDDRPQIPAVDVSASTDWQVREWLRLHCAEGWSRSWHTKSALFEALSREEKERVARTARSGAWR
ncbi:MAG: hypothetical protein ACYTAF_11450 [Planctomycetota bacterium]